MAVDLLTAASIVGAHADDDTFAQLWGPVFFLMGEAVAFGVLTYYFLRRGVAIHRLLLHEPASP